MTHVLRNLLNNAINHTKDGGTIRVTITRDHDGSRVSVVNPGPTIPEEAIELIWERYQRVQHQGGRREGSGIGLSIVSKVLSVLGFDFGVNSADGVNAFWFSVPEEPA
jgi:signal transduction histidine kinase